MKRSTLQIIADALAVPGASHDVAMAILRSELGTVVATPIEPDELARRREYERDRKARQRASLKLVPADVPVVPVCPGDVPADVPGTSSPSLELSPSPVSSPVLENSNSSQRSEDPSKTARAADVPASPRAVPEPVPEPVSQVTLRKASPCGMATDGWREGVRAVTALPYEGITHSVRKQVEAALMAHCPPGLEIVAWAEERGRAFATSHKGRDLSPYKFMSWLNSGCPAPFSGPGPAGPRVLVQPQAAPGKSRWSPGSGLKNAQGAPKS